MTFTVQSRFAASRPLPGRESRPGAAGPSRYPRPSGSAARPVKPTRPWMVDIGALAFCRQLLAGHAPISGRDDRTIHLSPMDVPAAYDQFCESHFASVRRLHPELGWDDACPAYAIALAAHAALCVALDPATERRLEAHWEMIRGESRLDWSRARSLVADGCSALDRIDPLAMHP